MSEDERRRSFRIDDRIFLRMTSLSKAQKERESQSQADQELKKLRELNFQSSHFLAQIRKSNPEIAQYLGLMDKKITILTQLIAAEQFKEPIAPTHLVNVSATGLSLLLNKCSVTAGTLLQTYMVFFPSYLTIECVSKAVYCRPDGGRFRLGLEFEDLDETIREQLIRHLIERQSEQIRRQREQGNAPAR